MGLQKLPGVSRILQMPALKRIQEYVGLSTSGLEAIGPRPELN